MVFLPVVERELRVTARRKGTYRLRLLAVMAMVATLGWQMLMWRSRTYMSTSQQGLALFEALIWVAFFFAALSGVIATSDCISSEKRDGTLGLLFLTDLKGYEVIGGKLAANSIHVIFALIAFLPIMAIPLLMGGITITELGRAALSLISLILISLSVGVYISTCSRNERRALFFTLALLAAIICLPFFLTFWSGANQQNIWHGLLFSPGFAVLLSFERFSTWPKSVFWLSLGWTWTLALLFLTLASIKIPHSWKEANPARKKNAALKIERPRRRAVIRSNPFEWLAMQGETRTQNVWILVGALFALWLVGLAAQGNILFERGAVVVIMVLLNGFFKFWIASESSRRFMEDRKNNAFELLLSTPLNETKIISGQWSALLKQFGPPIIFATVWEIGMLVGQSHYRWSSWQEPVSWQISMLLFLGLDLIALSWLGMWLGIKIKSRSLAIVIGAGIVVILPWLLSYLGAAVFSSGSMSSAEEDSMLHGCLIFFAVTVDFLVIFISRHLLFANFRRLATEGHGRRGD